MRLIEPEPPFCVTGCLLALQFQRVSAAAVERAMVTPSMALQSEVLNALREFLEHVQSCPKCEED